MESYLYGTLHLEALSVGQRFTSLVKSGALIYSSHACYSGDEVPLAEISVAPEASTVGLTDCGTY